MAEAREATDADPSIADENSTMLVAPPKYEQLYPDENQKDDLSPPSTEEVETAEKFSTNTRYYDEAQRAHQGSQHNSSEKSKGDYHGVAGEDPQHIVPVSYNRDYRPVPYQLPQPWQSSAPHTAMEEQPQKFPAGHTGAHGSAAQPYPLAAGGTHFQPACISYERQGEIGGTAPQVIVITQNVNNRRMQTADSYMCCSIFNLICCCCLIGIAAVYASYKTSQANSDGRYGDAQRFSKRAKILNIICPIFGILFTVAYVLIKIYLPTYSYSYSYENSNNLEYISEYTTSYYG